MKIIPRDLAPGPRSFKRRGVAAAHRITVDCKPGRMPAPVVTRWSCSCGVVGPELRGTDGAESNRLADAHLAETQS